MVLHQNYYNKYYTINYHENYLEIDINFIPNNNNFNKTKILFDLLVYYEIKNVIIKYKGKIFYNGEELKKFFKIIK